jgi:hypothetical protein
MMASTGSWANEGFMLSYHVDEDGKKALKPLASSNGDRQHSGCHDCYSRGVDEVILPYLNHRKEMITELRSLLKLPDRGTPVPVLVMCANGGHMPLILNFVCNLRAKGIALPKHVFVANTKKYADQLKAVGLTAYYHKGLSMGIPDVHAGAYGDGTFARAVMLKQFATALALEAGADVLFQDADLVWEQDPIPHLLKESALHKTQWMDDGSRDTRWVS